MENNKMLVHSKSFVQQTPTRRLVAILLQISSWFILLCGIISFNFILLVEAIGFVFIIRRIRIRVFSKKAFDYFLAEITFDADELKIDYQPQGRLYAANIHVGYEHIQKIEYCEAVKCFRLIFDTKIPGVLKGTYHWLFMEAPATAEFAAAIRKATELPINSVSENEISD